MAMHPCCGGSLQTGTKIVAIVQLISYTVVLIFSLFLLVGGIISAVAAGSIVVNPNSTSTANGSHGHFDFHNIFSKNGTVEGDAADANAKSILTIVGVFAIVTSVIYMLYSGFSIIISIILLQGANQRNVRKCRVWLVIRCILMVIAVVSFIAGFFHQVGPESAPNGHAGSALGVILDLYCIWVVYAFVDELREEESASTKRSMYTNKA